MNRPARTTLTIATIAAAAARVHAQTSGSASAGAAAGAVVTEQKISNRAMHYFVSLPDGWSPERGWPVLVVITDAYREFQSTARAFAQARGARPFIIVVPLVLSGGAPARAHANDFDYSAGDWSMAAREGNCRFDERGITAMLADVRARYHAEPRMFIAGWEAGGHVVPSQLFNHPERLRGVVAVTPNFQSRCVDRHATAAGAAAPIPIRGFHGSDDTAWGSADRPWLVDQWQRADSLARARGFANVKDTVIQGEGHGAMPSAIVEFFGQLVGRSPRR